MELACPEGRSPTSPSLEHRRGMHLNACGCDHNNILRLSLSLCRVWILFSLVFVGIAVATAYFFTDPNAEEYRDLKNAREQRNRTSRTFRKKPNESAVASSS